MENPSSQPSPAPVRGSRLQTHGALGNGPDAPVTVGEEQMLRAVADVNRELARVGTADQALGKIADGVREVVDAEVGMVLLPNDWDGVGFHAPVGHDMAVLESVCRTAAERLAATVVRSATTWVSKDVCRDCIDQPNVLVATRLGPAIFVPLTIRRRVVAVVVAARMTGRPAFDEAEVRAAELFAAQVRLLLESHVTGGVLVHDATSLPPGQPPVGQLRTAWSTDFASSGLAQALDGLSRTVVEVAGVAACTIHLIQPEGRGMIGGSYGLSEALVTAMDDASRTGRHPAVQCVTAGAPLVVVNERQRLLADPDWRPLADVLADERWDAVECLPVSDAQGGAALSVYFKADARPSESNLDLMRFVATEVTGLIANGRSFAAVDETVAEGERRRLAGELHDSVSQALYGITLGARTALASLDVDPERAKAAVSYLLDLAEEGLHEVRRLVSSMRQELVEPDEMRNALERQVNAIRTWHGVDVSADISAVQQSAPEARQAVLRIAQEALNNAVKHGLPRHVRIRLGARAGQIVLDVFDDGDGFDTHAEFPGHFGLGTMQDRTAALGGSLRLSSHPGEGTHVHAAIPAFPEPGRR